ncbi:hypothetical protein [uncultured Winogradskyella sp.]|uniref:hypothetical protein n=1 Tax=uncultured Winogradskyella sp. TaxID=395353 RepID=UPI0026302A7B|nr:hypothetical protein [uncultured Winogradskyella sp.]
MYITAKGLEQIHNQEELEYHERIVRQFKNEYDYAFKYEFPRTPNIDVVFIYDLETCKFRLVSISSLKFVHNRIVSTDPKIKKWFS